MGAADPLYYIAPGAEPTKFILFHEGGGFCSGISDCTQRAQGHLGSTLADGDSMELTDPYFSDSETLSPLLRELRLPPTHGSPLNV